MILSSKPILVLALLFATAPTFAQNVTITLSDLQNFRKAVEDAKFWQSTATDQKSQIAAANESAANWQKLYLSEKDRADRVQGGRIDEVKDANVALKLAIAKLEAQARRDADKIGEQNEEIISLKSSRKWYFGAGAVGGGVLGFFGGRQTCGVSIPGLSRASSVPDFRPMPVEKVQIPGFLRKQ
jgi:hypothetical protein